jgi:two-component system chemotaxis response regulator CheY
MTRVLVIDDAATIRKYYRQVLEPCGFVVDEAEDGCEGLERSLQSPHQLFVVDINMPRMDGYAVARALRVQAETRATPIIMISTESRPSDRDRALTAGANVFLIKPVKPTDLVRYARMLTAQGAS